MEDEALELCDNCQKEYPESKMGTHIGYCRRNIKKCQVCKQMYDINFQEEHDEEYHREETCPHCQRSLPSAQFVAHEKNCTQKPKYCQYCDLNVPVKTYPVHLKECEARTKPCDKCNRPISNKDFLVHLVSCNGIQEQPPRIVRQPVNSYQDHMQQQRRQIESSHPSVASHKSRDKVQPTPSYEYKGVYESKARVVADKQYVPILPKKEEPRVISYLPRQEVRHEVRPQQKKQSNKYSVNRAEVKKSQAKQYINSINPPTTFSYAKKEESKPAARVSGTSQNQPSYEPTNNRRSGTGSRQAPKQIVNREPVSSKDIYPSRSNAQKPTYNGVKEVKSVEKKHEVPKREERPAYGGITSSSNPRNGSRVPEVPRVQASRVPEVKRVSEVSRVPESNRVPEMNRVIEASRQHEIRRAPEVKKRVIYESTPAPTPQNTNFLQQEYAMGALDISTDDHQLQMAIMQSMGTEGGSSKGGSYTFQNEWSNPSFIEQQRKIEEQLKNKRR